MTCDHTIAHAIERGSEAVLQIEHGSLYPALHRLENRGWIVSFWGTSDNNRKAKHYRLTPIGRKQLAAQTTRREEIVRADSNPENRDSGRVKTNRSDPPRKTTTAK